tara:strand:- start:3097 stop:3384 length:288 start_codon:yes stop_codon:yes gene_type:complete
MADITKLKDHVQKAQHASDLINNGSFKEAVASVEKQYLEAALIADTDESRKNYLEGIKATRMVARHLRISAENGKLAASDLKSMEAFEQSKKRKK